MDNRKPNIKLLKTIEGYYFFDTNTNNIIEINNSIYNYLDDECKENVALSAKDNETMKEMKDRGLLSEIKTIEIQHGMTDYLEDILNNELSHLCLQVTQNCNLRCQYCVFSGSYKNRQHSNRRMEWAVAKKAIDFLHDHSGNSDDEILIGFYGGEPILEIELIKKCIGYTRELFRNKNVQFNLTTNATMLNEEIIDYLLDNNVAITISLDGPEEVQNAHRVKSDGTGSYQNVMENIEIILSKKKYEEKRNIIFNSVLSDDVDLKSVITFFSKDSRVNTCTHQISLVNDVNLVSDKVEKNDYNRAITEYEKFKTFLYGIGRVSKKMVSQMGFSYVYSLVDSFYDRSIGANNLSRAHPGGPCIPGQHKLFCDVDGRLYPCERVSETSEIMRIGDIYSGFNIEAAKRILNVGKVTKEQCLGCWAFEYCTQCIAFADGGNEISREKRLQECGRVKKEVEEKLKDYIVLQKLGCRFENFLP